MNAIDSKIKNLFTVSYLKNVFVKNFYEVFFISIFISFLQRPPAAHTRLPSRKEVQLFVNTFISIFLIYMLMDTFAPQFVNNVRMGLAVAIGTQLAGGIKLKKD